MLPESPAAWIQAARTRGDCKRLGAALDADPILKGPIVALAQERGVGLPDDASGWPGKRLLRLARGRATESQTRRNPIARDEAFRCVHCGRDVTPHGRTARDHCPFCLHGLHVDAVTPGDRASSCEGLLVPVGVEGSGGGWVLVYRCQGCGTTRRNRVLEDGDPPDDWRQVVKLTGDR